MKHTQSNKRVIFFLVSVSGFAVATCYPTGIPELTSEVHAVRDETQFPNGTVMGKYTYLDNEGNPVQVKYYADESSYGVELKSIKVSGSTEESNSSQAFSSPTNTLVTRLPDSKTTDADNFNELDSPPRQIANDLFTINKGLAKVNRYNAEKPSSEFETYYQNEVKGPKKCNGEKVRVYFDKQRKIRNVINKFEAVKYCEQF